VTDDTPLRWGLNRRLGWASSSLADGEAGERLRRRFVFGPTVDIDEKEEEVLGPGFQSIETSGGVGWDRDLEIERAGHVRQNVDPAKESATALQNDRPARRRSNPENQSIG